MKIVVFGPEKRTGVLRGGDVVDISLAHAKWLLEKGDESRAVEIAAAQAPSDLGAFIEAGSQALDNAEQAVAYLFDEAGDRNGPEGAALVHGFDDVTLHAPRARGARVACAGGNFADHAEAMAKRAAQRGQAHELQGDGRQAIRNMGIWGFWKVDRESLGPGGVIPYPGRAKRLDYEGELAIVLGKSGKNIRAEDIEDYVWGVTLLGDWSVRLAPEPGPMKFAMQKNFDGCCSIGPCIVVGEADPFDTEVETYVNGERRQHFNSGDMVFSYGEYLEYLSSDFTLYPGDMISGGTAAGTAADSAPLKDDGTPDNAYFLNPGDAVEIRSPAIGVLGASVVATE